MFLHIYTIKYQLIADWELLVKYAFISKSKHRDEGHVQNFCTEQEIDALMGNYESIGLSNGNIQSSVLPISIDLCFLCRLLSSFIWWYLFSSVVSTSSCPRPISLHEITLARMCFGCLFSYSWMSWKLSQALLNRQACTPTINTSVNDCTAANYACSFFLSEATDVIFFTLLI